MGRVWGCQVLGDWVADPRRIVNCRWHLSWSRYQRRFAVIREPTKGLGGGGSVRCARIPDSRTIRDEESGPPEWCDERARPRYRQRAATPTRTRSRSARREYWLRLRDIPDGG